MKKQTVRTERTKKAIYDAFWEVYSETPINRITVSDITRLAGIHRSTFYLYFTDIFDLLKKAEEELLQECNRFPSELENVIGDHTLILDMMIKFYNSNVSKLNVLLGAGGDPGFQFELKKRMIPKLLRLLSLPDDDSEMRIILDYAITMMLSLLTYSYTNLPDEPIDRTVQRIHTILSIGAVPLIEARTQNPVLIKMISEKRSEASRLIDEQLRTNQ